jgi:hypothetical protein
MEVTYHVVVTFDRDPDGDLKPGEAQELPNSRAAERRAGALALEHAGVIAFAELGRLAAHRDDDDLGLGRPHGFRRYVERGTFQRPEQQPRLQFDGKDLHFNLVAAARRSRPGRRRLSGSRPVCAPARIRR